MSKIQSGVELVNSFFDEIQNNNDFDQNLTNVLFELYRSSKLNSKNISEQLEILRKKDLDE